MKPPVRLDLVFLALGLSALAALPARATTFTSIMESIRVQARPGQVVTEVRRLTLARDQPRTRFRAHAEDWWRSEDGRQSFYRPPGTLARSAAGWVTLNPVEAEVEPGGTLEIRLTIAVPAEVQPGGYWAVLTIDEIGVPPATREGVGLHFLASVSSGIFVYIEPVRRAATISRVEITDDRALVGLTNDGDAPLAVEGRFEFRRPGVDAPVAVVPIPRGTLLPEPIRTGLFAVSMPDAGALPSGSYDVRVLVDIGLDHYLGVRQNLELRRGVDVPQAR